MQSALEQKEMRAKPGYVLEEQPGLQLENILIITAFPILDPALTIGSNIYAK